MASPEISICVLCGVRITTAGAEFIPCARHAEGLVGIRNLLVIQPKAAIVGPKCPAGWQPIGCAPWDRTVLVMGKSGYVKPRRWYQTLAYRVRGWHQDGFNGMNSERLTDYFEEPLFWREPLEFPEG
jgi:hypothetical protein